jgi:putative peptidoglycan lipid II flippase
MFILDVTLAAVLGIGVQSDALYAAWSLPLTIGRGAFQSLTNSLIGLFAESVDDRIAFSQAITVIAVIATSMALMMSVTSRWWLPITVPGAQSETRQAGIPLAAILSWLIALFAMAETQRAIYYRLEMNVVPSVVRVIGTFTSILLIITAANGQNLVFIAYGLLIGAAVEMSLGFINLYFKGHKIGFSWPPRLTIMRMARVVGLPLLGQGVLISASTVERALASYLGPGTVTAVAYANRIFQMLERFVFRGFVIATIQAYTRGLTQHWRRDTRILLLLSVPMMVIFSLMSPTVIEVLFERGRFTAEATELVGLALQTYAFAIPIVALNRIPYALAFAKNMSRELLIYAFIFGITLVGAEIVLINFSVGVQAFGIAQIVALITASIWLYNQVMRSYESRAWSLEDISRILGVTALVYVGTSFVLLIVQRMDIEHDVRSWVMLFSGVMTSFILTVMAAFIFRIPEAARISNVLREARN